jgi:hypothetical protein
VSSRENAPHSLSALEICVAQAGAVVCVRVGPRAGGVVLPIAEAVDVVDVPHLGYGCGTVVRHRRPSARGASSKGPKLSSRGRQAYHW